MSATREPARNGPTAQEGWSLDHCEAEVAHLYKVLHRYRSMTEESGWAQFDARARPTDDRRRRATAPRGAGESRRA